MIQNKGQHEHEYHTRCECNRCVCDSYPYKKLCYFCENEEHNGHECGIHLILNKSDDTIKCEICNKKWIINS